MPANTQPGAYSYQQLQASRNIRLIRLSPDANQLSATIVSCALVSAKFEFLSCVETSTSSKRDKLLVTPHGSILITEHLEESLKSLRHQSGFRFIWVEALCIQPNNDLEKANQIALMGEILRTAQSVLVWLGSLSLHTLWSFEYLEVLAEESSNLGIDPPTGDFRVWIGSPQLKDDSKAITILESALLAHIESFYDRPWFSNLCAITESIIPTNLILYSGNYQMKWATFEIATTLLLAAFTGVGVFPTHLQSVFMTWKLIELRNKYHIAIAEKYLKGGQYLTPSVVANEMKSQKCPDDRDRVYGLLPLNGGHATIIPDYTKTIAQVYTEYAIKLGGSEMLFDAGLARRHPIKSFERLRVNLEEQKIFSKQTYLPSWVPDLRSRGVSEWKPIFSNGFRTSSMSLGNAYLSPDCPQMYFIHGIRFDYVETCIGITGEDFKPLENATSFFTMVSVLKNFYKDLLDQFQAYPNGQKWSFAWPRAIATTVPNDSPHPLQRYLGDDVEVTDESLEILWESYEAFVLDEKGEIYQAIEMLSTEKIPNNLSELLTPAGQHVWCYHSFLAEIFQRHMIVKTKNGYVGLAPKGTENGHAIAVFGGPRCPFVIQSVFEDESVNLLIGPCFVQGLMNGEIYQGIEKKKFDWTELEQSGETIPLMSEMIGLV